MKYIATIFVIISALAIIPHHASAHQPYIVTEVPVTVTQPEISKAYYSTLVDKAQVYLIHAPQAFDLYVNVLVPDIEGQKKDVSAVIVKDGKQIAVLDGTTATWKSFLEPFAHDKYFMGPEYRSHVEAGEYQIAVWSTNNDSKYSLAIGEIEKFSFKDSIRTLSVIPELKKNFFNKSPIDFMLAPFGYGQIIVLYILAIIFALIYRALLKRFAKNTIHSETKNIGMRDRLLRLGIGIALIILAITTTWNPFLIFFSGFCLFEAAFSWCGFYAAIGRTTCPM